MSFHNIQCFMYSAVLLEVQERCMYYICVYYMFINLKNITMAFNEKVNVQECPFKIYRKEQINKVSK